MFLKIKNNIKEAMKTHDVVKKDVLKMVIDKARTIMKQNNPTSSDGNIPDDIILQAISKEMKQLEQTKDLLVKNNKTDTELYVSTIKKIGILNEYIPKQMTREEVIIAVHKILDGGDYVNFGMMMKAVMSQLKGKADAKLIKEVVESL